MTFAPVLYNGDCRDRLDRVEDGSAQLVLTSPPYNLGKAYERREPLAQYEAWLGGIIRQCAAKVAPGGSFCLQLGTYTLDGEIVPLDLIAYPPLRAAGLKLRNRVVWIQDHGLHARRRFSGRHEVVLWATRGDDYVFDLDAVRVPQKHPGKRFYKGPRKGELSCHPLGKNPGDVWAITQVKNRHPEKTAHPCQFPEELARRLILATTRPGDLVVDPFAGSGTVGVVAQRLGRRSVLIERDVEYCLLAHERIAGDRERAA